MKYLLTIFLLSLNLNFSSSKKYNLTTNYYNTTLCDRDLFKSFSIIHKSCGNNTNINKCLIEKNGNYSFFQTCKKTKKEKVRNYYIIYILLPICLTMIVYIIYKCFLYKYLNNIFYNATFV